jgi:hypothetical protein
VRDRTCAVPGCPKRLGLERDHRCVDFGDDGPTELDNLVRLCPEHHDLKTHGGWRLEGKPGSWEWVAPAHPKSANYIARARRLAAAKGRASAAATAAATATESDGAKSRARAEGQGKADVEAQVNSKVQVNGEAQTNGVVRRSRGSP